MRKSVGEELTRGNDAEVGWRKYFVQLLNGGEIRLLGRRCWQLAIRREKKDIWKCTEKRRKGLKSVYKVNGSLEGR